MSGLSTSSASKAMTAGTTTPNTLSSIPPPLPAYDVEVVGVDSKVTESNSSWWKCAYTIKIKNNGSSAVSVKAKMQWLDKEGFVIDDDYKYDVYVGVGQTTTVQDYDLIDASVAPNIASTKAEVSP
jgi:hypothetical protein